VYSWRRFSTPTNSVDHPAAPRSRQSSQGTAASARTQCGSALPQSSPLDKTKKRERSFLVWRCLCRSNTSVVSLGTIFWPSVSRGRDRLPRTVLRTLLRPVSSSQDFLALHGRQASIKIGQRRDARTGKARQTRHFLGRSPPDKPHPYLTSGLPIGL